MMRAARLTACLALMLAAACGPKPRPITLHDLQQNDVAVCFKSASIGNTHMEGGATLLMYVDADGAIPASWFYDGAKLASPTFYRCMTTTVVESMLAAAPVDHLFGVNVTCEENGCQLLPFDKLPDGPLDESLASATLTFSDWADSTDKAWAYYYTHKYSDAQAAFSSILEVTPNDPRALRGLAQTLTDSGGDMKKAREAADKAVSLQKNAATLEALVRVCLKTGDDECAVKNFVDATHDAAVTARRFDLAQLNAVAKAANDRLAAADQKRDEDAAKVAAAAKAAAEAKSDPLGCGKLAGDEQAKCYIKGCFAAGADTYAKELSKLSKQSYSAGEITAAPGKDGETTVTIPVRTPAVKHKKPDTNQDATWAVVLATGQMRAASATAAVISKDHNACK